MPNSDRAGLRREHPRGPLAHRVPCGAGARLWAGVVALACLSVMVMAGRLSPEPDGLGTHTQLGVPACSVPATWGIPCPTCGVTTAFAHAAQGRMLTALAVQPVGGLAAAATLLLALASGSTVVTGRKWVVNWSRVPALRLAVAAVAVVLLAWVYKIATYKD